MFRLSNSPFSKTGFPPRWETNQCKPHHAQLNNEIPLEVSRILLQFSTYAHSLNVSRRTDRWNDEVLSNSLSQQSEKRLPPENHSDFLTHCESLPPPLRRRERNDRDDAMSLRPRCRRRQISSRRAGCQLLSGPGGSHCHPSAHGESR